MSAGAGSWCAAVILLVAAAGSPVAAQEDQRSPGLVFSAASRVGCATFWRMLSATSVIRGSCHSRHPRLSGAAKWCKPARSLLRDT